MKNNSWTWAAIAVLATLGLIYFLNSHFPGALESDSAQMRLVYLCAWLTLIGGGTIMGWRRHAGLALKQALAWLAAFLILIIVYNARGDLMGLGGQFGQQFASSLTPTHPVQASPGTVYLTRGLNNSHFQVDAIINGHALTFLIDTGASVVSFSEANARRLGLDPAALSFTQPMDTANGTTMAAPVTLASIQVGDITVHNVRAAVLRGDGGMALLGMSFLDALGSYEFKGERLVLRR
jgi:aspartyl protease family protein